MRTCFCAHSYARKNKGNTVKGFWKDLTDKQRKELLMRFVSVILSGVILVAIGIGSFAWFSANSTAGQTGMEIIVSSDAADVLIEKTAEYDDAKYSADNISGLKSKFTAAGYSTLATSTGSAATVVNEFANEYVVSGKRYMQPGAYGTVTFYLRPKAGKDGSAVTFGLARGAFTDDYYDHDDNAETPPVPVVTEVTTESVIDLLKGHILFFTGRTGATYEDYVYSGFLDGETFSYDMSANVKCADDEILTVYDGEGNAAGICNKTECYKVVLYWDWPITYGDIKENTSTTEPAETKKYPAAVGTYLSAHPEYFFVGADLRTDEDKGNAYDDGDQTIGDAVHYFTLYLKI